MKTIVLCWLAVALGVLMPGRGMAAELPTPEPVTSVSAAYDRYLEVVARTKKMRQERDTKGLEALAAELRASKDALDGGTWMLSHFYANAVSLPEKEPEAGEAVRFYEKWASESPQSITAQVCLARALTAHAWKARGTGWSDSVTEEGWKKFGERLDLAWAVLEAAENLDEKCPGWYEAGQVVALGQGWDRDEYLEYVDDAIKHEPTYGKYYTNACYWLLPRWHGEEGDFEAWITRQADSYPQEKRDSQYARYVWMADQMGVDRELVFAPGRLDWERTKRGFETWLAADPGNLNVRFEFTRLALRAGDRETARMQFEMTGGKYFVRGWTNVAEFEKARRYAYEGGPNPFTEKRAEKSTGRSKAKPQLRPETVGWMVLILRIAGGFMGGALAGTCLLVLGWQRRDAAAGTVALAACVLSGAILGTLATAVPAGIFYLYMRRKKLVHPPELAPASGWIVLVWVIVLGATPLILQLGVAIVDMITLILQNGPVGSEEGSRMMMRSGAAFRATVVTAWLAFLGLLIACGPQNREGWKRRLGLNGFRVISSALWTLGAAVIVSAAGFGADKLMDEYSKKSLLLIAEGIHSPIWYFLAVALVAPIGEELLFRGYAFSGWVGKLGPWGAILIPTALFTCCHIQYGWAGLLYVFIMGVTLGVLRWRTGSIYPCIAIHATANLLHCIQVAREAWA